MIPSFFLHVAFFLSGIAALVYEILWVRLLNLHLGHTPQALALVLSSYMAGLAAGGYFGGQWANRLNRRGLLGLFALCELGVAIAGFCSQPLLNRFFAILAERGYGSIGGGLLAFGYMGSFVVLFVPTFFMGVTLPVLTRWVTDRIDTLGIHVGRLYGANTLGSMTGVLLAIFVLLPRFGVQFSFSFAAALNMLIGMSVFLFGVVVDRGQDWIEPRRSLHDRIVPQKAAPVILFIALFMTGAGAMMLELAWSRVLAMVLGSSIYGFSIVLVTMLFGLSLGAFCYGFVRRYFSPTMEGLSITIGLIAVAVTMYTPLFNKIPYYFVRAFPLLMSGPLLMHVIQFLLCAAIMIVPTVLIGMLFPWTCARIQNNDRAAPGVGQLYAANTIGNIAGSALTGMVVLPWIGVENTLRTAAWIYFVAAAMVFLFGTRAFENAPPSEPVPGSGILRRARIGSRRILITGAAAFLFLLTGGIQPNWDPHVISSGAFLYAPDYRLNANYASFLEDLHQNRLLYYKDGLSSTVGVYADPWGNRFLRVNGKTDASTGTDMNTQLLLGHLPVLLHPGKPTSALVVGFGSGVTAGAVAAHPQIQTIDCVELEPAVMDAAYLFTLINNNIHRDPRFHPHLTDARRYLSATKEKFDLITSEPSNPWMAGISNLYTKEAFELSRSRLKPNGIFCQWFHSYSMTAKDFRMIMNTFADVFPHVMLLTTGEKDFFFIGSNDPFAIDYEKIEEALAPGGAVRMALTPVGFGHPFVLLAGTFLLDDADFRRHADESPIHHDDRPTLEFSAPYALHRGEDEAIMAELLASKKRDLPGGLVSFHPTAKEWSILYNMIGERWMRLMDPARAEEAFEKALSHNRQDPRTLTNIARVHNAYDRHLAAERSLKKSLDLDPTFALAWFHLGMLYVSQGLEEKGLAALRKGLDHAPGDPMGALQAGGLLLKQKKYSEAKTVVEQALQNPMLNVEFHKNLSGLLQEIRIQSERKSPYPEAG